MRRSIRTARIAALTAALFAVLLMAGSTSASARTIRFSGLRWDVKTSHGLTGPGPNRFSDSARSVWVDAHGRLHLRIARRHGHWYCTEIVSDDIMGYGTYTWDVVGRPAALDPNVVLGLFTWADAPRDHHREIDIEWSRWGQPHADDASYTVQPYQHHGNEHAFMIARRAGARTTQSFDWEPRRVRFASLRGFFAPPWLDDAAIQRWRYTGDDVPAEGAAHTRINLWLFRGARPTDRRPASIVIRSFTYTPAP